MLLKDSSRRYPLINWLRYSGACATITVNPWHWTLVPQFYKDDNNGWLGPNERTWRMSWLMITVRVWVDNGAW